MGPIKKPSPMALLSVITTAGFSYVVAVVVAMHFLRPDLSPISSPISEYAVGPNGLLFTSALLTWGIASLALAAGLRRGIGPPGPSRTGLALLTVFGVGLIIASIFPMDVPFPPADFPPGHFTAAGATHITSATVATICFPCMALLLSKGFEKDPRWRSFRRPARVLALGSLAAVVGLFVASGVDIHLFGIAQRIVAAFALMWQFLTALGLHAANAEKAPARPT
jgi:hypothetical protein